LELRRNCHCTLTTTGMPYPTSHMQWSGFPTETQRRLPHQMCWYQQRKQDTTKRSHPFPNNWLQRNWSLEIGLTKNQNSILRQQKLQKIKDSSKKSRKHYTNKRFKKESKFKKQIFF
jgi:hypothetical protein